MNFFQLLLLAFVLVPIAEIYVLIEVGGVIGVGYTLALIILTAVIGAALMRAQGLATLGRLRAELERGEPPAQTIVEGVMLLFAGALLLTPGFITDTLGFLCLTPAVRAAVARRVVANAVVSVAGAARGASRRYRAGSGVIDGEYTREDDPDGPDRRRLDD